MVILWWWVFLMSEVPLYPAGGGAVSVRVPGSFDYWHLVEYFPEGSQDFEAQTGTFVVSVSVWVP